MASNGFQGSYANERPPSSTGSGDADIAADPASSSFFMNDYKKHEDLKTMLDSNKDSLKLEAMKRIIGMVAKGKDVSDLFPPIVKNVVSKNPEVKKLVFVYLVRYAEEQQDLALLSISTFQRALKDPNQLIRASALRVLSSIRVPVIVPIMMLAIKESVMDMSPYVRKTAAHAIPKLYSLDPEQKDILIEVIEKLLADKTTLVAGSAIQAFEEVCPERIDLIHKNYRKLCSLLVDVEEWGQVVIINMLSRYARTQFINPNQEDVVDENCDKAFYASSDESAKDEEEKPKKKPYVMDQDHRLLLRTCKPLLNSRNAAVVMAVAQLYHHCAPRAEVNLIAKALVRLLRSHKEVQFVVLSNIAAVSIKRKGMFEPFLKSFYVRSNDPLPVKLLKLEILTNLATETNISTILREFQTYVISSDKDFAAATIQAIGRCASNIDEITDACLNGLVSLMSNRDESVVAESVVVIKKLLQMQPTEHKDIIIHMAKLVDSITVPMARASILWLIGEYSDRVPKIAPDVLRKMAKNFINEENIVKLQVLNLAAKLAITNSKQTKLLTQYVFNLAKYDQNYDIRDRTRFLRQLIMPSEKTGNLPKHTKKIFLATKPAPVLQSRFKDRDQYQLGTLSHLMDTKATGYQELPDWPEEAPDPTVRNVEVAAPWLDVKLVKKSAKKKSFYSDTESSGTGSSSTEGEDGSEDESSEAEEESGSESKEGSDKSDSEETEKSESEEESSEEESSEEEEEESSSDADESESETDSEEERKPPPKVTQKKKIKEKESQPPKGAPSKPSAQDLLLDLDDANMAAVTSPLMTPGDVLTPTLASDLSSHSLSEKVKSPSRVLSSAVFAPTKTYELLNRINGGGLSAQYRFTRSVSVFSPKMVSVEVTFINQCENTVVPLNTGEAKLQAGMELHGFPEINNLEKGASTSVTMGIDFNDTTQPASFDICTKDKKFAVTVKAPVGELIQPITMSENEFNQQQSKLTGMNENSGSVDLAQNAQESSSIYNRVYEAANVLQVPTANSNEYKFCGKTIANECLVLVKLVVKNSGKASIVVNCEKMVIGSMLLKDLKTSLSRA